MIAEHEWITSGVGEGQSLMRVRQRLNLLVLHPRSVLDEVFLDRHR